MLYQAVDDVASEYKPRVFQVLGNSHYCKGDIDAAVTSYRLAGKLGREHDPITFHQSHQLIAEIQRSNGDSLWAVKTFESVFPLVLTAARTCPASYYEYLNNYAVHLGDVGRVDEAQAAVAVALNSGCASAFPEWAKTRAELETKRRHPRRSFVAMSISPKPAEPKPPTKKRQGAKPKRRPLAVVVRALHWLAGLSIFTSVSSAPILAKSISVEPDALSPINSDWPTSGPGPRAPPAN